MPLGQVEKYLLALQGKWEKKLLSYPDIYDLVPKGVHENRTKRVENKVDGWYIETSCVFRMCTMLGKISWKQKIKTCALLEILADKGHKRPHVVHQILQGLWRSLIVWGKWDKLFKALKVCENWVVSVKVCQFVVFRKSLGKTVSLPVRNCISQDQTIVFLKRRRKKVQNHKEHTSYQFWLIECIGTIVRVTPFYWMCGRVVYLCVAFLHHYMLQKFVNCERIFLYEHCFTTCIVHCVFSFAQVYTKSSHTITAHLPYYVCAKFCTLI